jgi:predicted ATPase
MATGEQSRKIPGDIIMIRKLEVENFMSLKNVSVELEPLTVFIGPNCSGKSAVFKALVLASKLLNGVPLRGHKGETFFGDGVTLDDLVWNGDSGLPIRFRVWFNGDGDEPGYSLELRKRTEGWSVTNERIRTPDGWIQVDEDNPFEHATETKERKHVHTPPLRATLRYLVNPFLSDAAARPVIEPIFQLADKFGQAWRYRPSAIDIASFVKRPTERGRNIYVAENGWGTAAKLQDLHNSPADRKVFEAIENGLCRLFPHIQNIGFENDYLGVRLSYRTDRSYDPIRAPQESDGVLLATFLLWRLYTASPHLTLCLEEPENGLHPLLLAARFELLKKVASGGRQLLASTHSPEFLRALRAHPAALYKEVRLVRFTPAGGTCVDALHHYRDAAKLINDYLDDMHETWEPIVQQWDGGSPEPAQ